MYTIRGADNSEQGPLSTRQVRDLIARGEAQAATLARADGEDWKPLSTFPEFEPALRSAGILTSSGAAQPVAAAQTSRLALTAFCFSVFGFCGVTAIIGLVLGAIAWVRIRQRPARLTGTRFAAAAVFVSVFFLIALPLAFSFVMTHGQRSMRRQWMGSCQMHVSSLSQGMRILSIANNQTYPPADNWCDALKKEITTPDQFRCPNDTNATLCSYAYNARVAGAQNVNPNTVVIFEADLDWNGSGGPGDLLAKPRHGGYVVVALANGSVQRLSPEAARKLRWDP